MYRLQKLVYAIHQTNALAKLTDGRSLLALLNQRDELVERHKILTSAISNTQREPDRYSTREIKWHKVIPVSSLQKQSDDISAKLRDLDVLIQATNWQVDLLDV
ncbi:DIP1984 family protein [Acinetobacter guillouiae]|uniref:DIP1984 family protein n=1 Tax=Acinetobacter guillouiae TaxID=106649 RepID=UPI003A52168E